MNTVGAPADAASILAAQAQQLANKSRQAQKPRSDAAKRYNDSVELRVAGAETADAVTPLSHTGDESPKREGRDDQGGSENPHVDVKA
jgi:hypothetical protein